MRGAKPKPRDQKKAAGTLRKDRSFADEMIFDSLTDKPKAPEFLGEYGRAEWDRVVTQLFARGILSETDLTIIQSYCYEMEQYYSDRDIIKSGNKYIRMTNKAGETYLAVHPAVNAGNKHLANALKIATEFGLTPSSRTRISTSGAKEKNPDEAKLMKLTKGA
ncbi:MAG TPA: phage terminase small subunit P27 family [Chryseosolibacter sp.]|nr:phage terminase small subunit P27 family [Chryseosolibacter sp.]